MRVTRRRAHTRRSAKRVESIAWSGLARQRGRSLLLLHTRHGEPPERFCKGLGYREAGVIPGYITGPAGERHDHALLYLELAL